ncbi:hypothetical protein VKT23_010760 [Stygiomarasmius scandens]|uniref:Uncharacterized protein n=1 Tax=Marasmiellus scandens TaxID=2682957 RepID=A0ABR1JA56_9AGAR
MSDFISIPLPPPPLAPLLSPLKTRTGRKLGAPTPAGSKTKAAVDTPLLADDEASPGEHCEEREDDENEVIRGFLGSSWGQPSFCGCAVAWGQTLISVYGFAVVS